MFIWTRQQREIKQLQSALDSVQRQLFELGERVYMDRPQERYGQEVYVNDAVKALAQHLNVAFTVVPESSTPRKAQAVPNR